MITPDVDVIIAVHTPTRPVHRAISSVLSHTLAKARITVVVHNTDPAPIHAQLLEFLDDPRVRFATHQDEYRTPAGPKNVGLKMATAPFVAMLDSDDTLEPGALDAWLAAARLEGGYADAVIAPTASVNGMFHPSPPVRQGHVRSGRLRPLNPVKDRLAYRSSPLGLIGRSKFAHLRFAEGVPTGEDQPLTAELWFSPGSRVVFPVLAPKYQEHHDQSDRVTGVIRSVAEEFRSLDFTLDPAAVWGRQPGVRLSLAAKLIRVHVFDAVRNRVGHGWDDLSAQQTSLVIKRILEWEPRARFVLARADEALLDALCGGSCTEAELEKLLAARSQLRSAQALLPKRLRFMLHAQAPLRFHAAGVLLARRVNRPR
ncbi:glycosyltransferase family A protein [Leucobacter salsicius]|uniref:glycosyltransferase family A protein n=1 Tax=Leucobacter salsicius TaxID=664638 RepID=UPI00034AA712|nr:glycosyltransferase family A protein [Leucobacter salsicius]